MFHVEHSSTLLNLADFHEHCSEIFLKIFSPKPNVKVYEDDVFMIQCDICRDWLHGECVKVGREGL